MMVFSGYDQLFIQCVHPQCPTSALATSMSPSANNWTAVSTLTFVTTTIASVVTSQSGNVLAPSPAQEFWRLQLTSLLPGTEFQLCVHRTDKGVAAPRPVARIGWFLRCNSDHDNGATTRFRFRTMALRLNVVETAPITLAFGAGDELTPFADEERIRVYRDISKSTTAGLPPDVFVQTGNLHTRCFDEEEVDKQQFWERYHNVLAAPHMQEMLQNTPMRHIWNDRDYAGRNFAGAAAPGRDAALDAFRALTPQNLVAPGARRSVHQAFTVQGRVRVVMLDTSSNAATTDDGPSGVSPEAPPPSPASSGAPSATPTAGTPSAAGNNTATPTVAPPPPTASMPTACANPPIDAAQMQWLMDELAQADQYLLLVLVTPISYGGPVDGENVRPDHTWARCPRDRARIQRVASLAGNVFLVSGDTHLLAFDNGYNQGLPILQAGPLAGRAHVDRLIGGDFQTQCHGYFLTPTQQFGLLEIWEDASNHAVVRVSGRRSFPGKTEYDTVLDGGFSVWPPITLYTGNRTTHGLVDRTKAGTLVPAVDTRTFWLQPPADNMCAEISRDAEEMRTLLLFPPYLDEIFVYTWLLIVAYLLLGTFVMTVVLWMLVQCCYCGPCCVESGCCYRNCGSCLRVRVIPCDGHCDSPGEQPRQCCAHARFCVGIPALVFVPVVLTAVRFLAVMVGDSRDVESPYNMDMDPGERDFYAPTDALWLGTVSIVLWFLAITGLVLAPLWAGCTAFAAKDRKVREAKIKERTKSNATQPSGAVGGQNKSPPQAPGGPPGDNIEPTTQYLDHSWPLFMWFVWFVEPSHKKTNKQPS